MRYLSQFMIILGFTLIGETLHRLVPLPIPASVYGLVLLFLALCFGIIKVERVKQAGDFLISVMPVLFVSPMVGIAERWGLIAPHLVPIVLMQDGQITFCPTMLTDADFRDGELRFSYCGTEIIYRKTANGAGSVTLTAEQSQHIFARDGEIKQLIIEL